jgi:sulfopyruvate decarboxylase TPP-binding subunit
MFWTKKDRAAWERQNIELAENIVHAVQRDRGRRVLVAVQCQRLHRLIPLLQAHNDLFQIVSYQDL